MKRVFYYIIILFSLFVSKARAQNLVLNPSFEELDSSCCTYIPGTNDFYLLKDWILPNFPLYNANSDLFSSCFYCNPTPLGFLIPDTVSMGIQSPHTGNNFVGLYILAGDTTPMRSEYIQGELTVPLIANKLYFVKLFISLSDYCSYTCNGISVYFSANQISDQDWLLDMYSPQINFDKIYEKDSWAMLSATFMANGNEQYFTIGNFKQYDSLEIEFVGGSGTGELAYYFIDDIAIYPADAPVHAADAGGDRLLCNGESATLGNVSRSQYLYWWYDEQGNLIDTTAQITVSPDSTTFYVLQQKDFKFDETSDTVFVYVSDCESPLYIPNIFSPNGDGNNDIFRVRGEGISELKTFIVYNRWGQEVFSCHTSTPLSVTSDECIWDGTFRGQEAPEGVYSYYVEAVLLNGQTVTKKGNVTLVR